VKRLLLVTAALAALVLAGTAQASSQHIHSDQRVSEIASRIGGMGLQAAGEDDWSQWAKFTGLGADATAVLGFTGWGASVGLYNVIFISPDLWPTLVNAAANGAEASGSSRYQTAKAIMTLTHEAYHHRLSSSDEGRVNACALRAFPDVLAREFGVQSTVTTSRRVPFRAQEQYRVRLHHRWVYRYRWRTFWRSETDTAPSPVFQEFVADAGTMYRNQPPPYNTGTCY
jgi:hypothetical protein